MTLTEFLLARIAEDEERASWHHRLLCMRTACDREGCLWDEGEEEAMERERVCTCGYPARVLADVEAKRRIVELARENTQRWEAGETQFLPDDTACVLQLATIYADHPDYQEAWKP